MRRYNFSFYTLPLPGNLFSLGGATQQPKALNTMIFFDHTPSAISYMPMAQTSMPLTAVASKSYSSGSMDLAEEVKQVEKELVELIIYHLQQNKLDPDVARQQARDFLALLPVEDQKDLLTKLKTLGEKYEEAKTVYADELAKVNDTLREQTLAQMRDHIKAGNIDGAIAVAKASYSQ